MNYIPLWIKTDYSLLSSLIKVDDLIKKASLLGVKALGICDDNMFGVMEFYTKCINNNIKPIIGLEIKLDFTFLLYAKNYNGYQNLCVIDSLKNKNELSFDILNKYLSDVIVVIPYENKDKKDLFNSLNIFIGYDDLSLYDEIEGYKVYLNKTLSLEEEKIKYLSYLYKIGQKEFINDKNVYLYDEIDLKDAKTTIYFANLIDIKIPKNNDLLPVYNLDPVFDEKAFLTNLALKGLKKRLNNNVSEVYLQRLKYELNIIIKMGFSSYFLIVWDYVKYAKKNNILIGPGRGSAASSLVSYSLGITDIDPIKYNLLFERFLNPNRVTMPDIDIDFDALKREDVINYIKEKYGSDKVCGIITFSNLLAKQVIRDVARIFDYPNYKIDEFIKLFDDKKDLKYQIQNEIIKKRILDDFNLRKIYDIALNLEGLKRHLSNHAAGIIISKYDIKKYAPITFNDDINICGYTMNYIEDLGFLKMDLLALKNLSVLSEVLNKIGNLKLSDIPLDDKKTFDLFKEGLLDGVFQFESNGMKKFIMDLRPDNINDLIAAIALFRPGPIDNIPKFIRRKNKLEKIDVIDESLKDILYPTYGIIIYQEQIMQISIKMAGFNASKADELRRAMSKKKENELIKLKEDFIKGSIKNGYDKTKAEEVYNLILKFANYGFNKAHSVAYAILGYKMAYLKANFPKYFMCEILNNYIGVLNKTKRLVDECKKLNIKIEKPDINISKDKYEIINNNIIYPISIVKNIGLLTAKKILEERNKNGKYTSYIDFVKRNYKLGKDVISKLILSGMLDNFGYNKKTLIENLDDTISYADLISDLDESLVIKPEIKECDEYDNSYLSKCEKELFGFYISNHPTYNYINDKVVSLNNINLYFDKVVTLALFLERKKEVTTKNNEKMMFITASDIYSNIDLILFPRIYEKCFNINLLKVYKVTGKVEKRFSKNQIIVNDIKEV